MDMKALLLAPDPVRELRELIRTDELRAFEPALADLKMAIPTGYHHKDNLDHSVRVLERAIEREANGPDLILRTAALLHDIGKPATRKFEGKGVVTFRNHETVGARQAQSRLKTHGYSKADRALIERLVALHMRAFGFGEVEWTDSAVRRLATDAGSIEALDRLIVVFYSDLTTKHERKRRRVEDGIARLEDALARVRAKDERAALRPALNGDELMALTGMKPGREFGQLMRFLNSDEGVTLTRDEALAELRVRFPEVAGL